MAVVGDFVLENKVEWTGIGLHSGLNCKVTLSPGASGQGIRWRNQDQENDQHQPANLRQVYSTTRSTDIKYKDYSLRTVEHLFAALQGAGIRDVIIEVEGDEIPILNGSGIEFYNILVANRKPAAETVRQWGHHEVIHFEDEESGASYTYLPSDDLTIDVILEYDGNGIGQKHARYNSGQDFSKIAKARTFVFSNELVGLAQQGLIKGGSLSNAVVILSETTEASELEEALKILGRENIDDTVQKIKDGYQLQYDNELASHKLLDLIGDLNLLGFQLKGSIIARRPGHTGNIAFAKHLYHLYKKDQKLRGLPIYDATNEIIYGAEEIMGFLPHRYPFMLVDKIIELSDSHVVGIKNITFNEGLFQGHFPNNPIFPGVLQMEALAQTGGILALNGKENPSDWDTYFLKMDNVKFKNMVRPGDTLILKMELLSPIRRGIVHMQGTAYVADKIVSEGELTAQIVDRTTLKS